MLRSLKIFNNLRYLPKSKRFLNTININGYTETIIERSDYKLHKCREIINNEPIGIIGYGPQGRGQSLNLRDNGFNVNIGVSKG